MHLKTTIASLTACFTALLLSPFSGQAREASSGTGNSPLLFIENKGQIIDQNQKYRSDIDFTLAGKNVNVFIGNGQIHYQWSKQEKSLAELFEKFQGRDNVKMPTGTGKTEVYRLDATLVGAKMSKPVISDVQQYYENYYLSHCPEGISAHSFKKVTYQNVYPGIDWVIYIKDNSLKYDFVVRKGANPSNIKIQYSGASDMQLNDGALTVTTPFGAITEHKPYSYDAATKAEIPTSYTLNGNVLSFNLPAQNSDMVIDPTIGWATYYGLPSETLAGGIAANATGHGYLSGVTSNQTGITSLSGPPHQYTYGGGSTDAYIIKFNADGSRSWATYFGGGGFEQVFDAVCDNNGNFYLAGSTTSTADIAYFGHQGSFNGIADAFVAKFNSGGTRIWSSYYGGTDIDQANTVACDKLGNVYLGGFTASTSSIASTGAYQTSAGSSFLVKFNSSGTRQWGTYYGSTTGINYLNDATTDSTGNVYIVGVTDNQSLSSTNVHQATHAGATDGYVTKFNTSGQRVWCTYYGGTGSDEVKTVACDIYNNAYIGGVTYSGGGIASTGAFQTTFISSSCFGPSPCSDGFIAKLNASTSQRQWGTYFGGSGKDEIYSLHAGPERKLYVCGGTTSASGIATAGNYQTTFGGAAPLGGDGDAFLVKFDFDGKRQWGTYYGGPMNESTTKMAVGGGKIYIGGLTKSESGIYVAPGYQNYLPSPSPPPFQNTAFFAQFEADTAVYLHTQFKDTITCLTDTFHLSYGLTNNFRSGNNFTVQMSDPNGSFATPRNINVVTTNTAGSIKYWIPDTFSVGTGYRIRIISSDFADTTYDNGVNIRVSAYPKPGPVAIFPICANGTLQLNDTGTSPGSTIFQWSGPGGFSVGGSSYNRPNVQITDSGYYVLTADNYGCVRKDSVHVLIYSKPAKPNVQTNSPICVSDTLKVWATTSTPGVTEYNWAFYQGGVLVSYNAFADADSVIPNATQADTGMYVLVALAGGCPSDPDTVKVAVDPKTAPTVQIGANPGVNIGPWVQVTFSVTGFSNAGSNPTYQWSKNGTDIPNATNNTYTGTTGADLQTGDTICVRMTSSALCPIPNTATNCMIVNIDLGVNNLPGVGDIQLFPNPNNGNFVLKGQVSTNEKIKAEILNVTGQTVYRTTINPIGTNINSPMNVSDLPQGVYQLQLKSNEKVSVLRFSVTK
jgi:hypothetical protein